MARQKVEQIQCDRCKRVELQPVREGVEKIGPEFSATFLGKKLQYTDLCARCKAKLDHYWTEIMEWEREVKQALLGAQVPENQAAPLTVAPDYTPPKPHSAAGAKRS